MELGEYESLKQARVIAENETARLQKALINARLDDDAVQRLTSLARHALSITRFAVENLPPEMIKNWPYRELRMLAELMPGLPDHNGLDDDSLAIELRNFAGECERFERNRNLRSIA